MSYEPSKPHTEAPVAQDEAVEPAAAKAPAPDPGEERMGTANGTGTIKVTN